MVTKNHPSLTILRNEWEKCVLWPFEIWVNLLPQAALKKSPPIYLCLGHALIHATYCDNNELLTLFSMYAPLFHVEVPYQMLWQMTPYIKHNVVAQSLTGQHSHFTAKSIEFES